MYNVVNLSSKFIFKAIPNLKAQIACQEKIIEELFTPFMDTCETSNNDSESKHYSILEKHFFVNKGYVQAIYSLFPEVDSKKMLTFMIYFNMLTLYLDNFCSIKQIKDESVLHQLYLSMFEAVDPSREISNYFKYFPNDSDNLGDIGKNYLNNFVDSCRDQLKEIPSYELVKEYIKKYVYIKSDFYINKHISEENNIAYDNNKLNYICNNNSNEAYLFNWACPYLKQYSDLRPWEFQAAACSDLGLYILLAVAFDSTLDNDTIINIDKTYFPWINGLQALLSNYLNLYQNFFTNDNNPLNYYDNLKQCEERLTFFLKQSLKACSELDLNKIHISVVKLILIIYLSDPRAHLGLKEIASRNLLTTASAFDLRFWKTLMPLLLPSKYQCTYPY